MSIERHRVLPGTYCDSVVLMRLQGALEGEPGVTSAAAVMATPANREILEQGGLWDGAFARYRSDDLLIVVRADSADAADAALARADGLLRQRAESRATGRRFHSLAAALAEHPDAHWVALSLPGPQAAPVARQALEADRHVFLYSDNVSVAEEVALKELAERRGRLLLGPDCGSAILGGRGFGFSNHVPRGSIGLIGASGTGLQAVSCRLDDLGLGVSQMIGTGGRDLSEAVAARTTRQALRLLDQDPDTSVIALVSKPPSPGVAAAVLRLAAGLETPVVAGFVGGGARQDLGSVELAASLVETAERAAARLQSEKTSTPERPSAGRLVAYFAGGTLALEVAIALHRWLDPLGTNLGIGQPLSGDTSEAEPAQHRVIDLGDDAYTLGRPHPMIDGHDRLRRLELAAADPGVGTLLLDIVLGYGAEPDPATALAPVLERALELGAERDLAIGVLLVGSREDPQDRESQRRRLAAAGAQLFDSTAEVVRWVAERHLAPPPDPTQAALPTVDSSALLPGPVINVGLDSFATSLGEQGVEVIPVDWRPPAGGNRQLVSILERMKNR